MEWVTFFAKTGLYLSLTGVAIFFGSGSDPSWGRVALWCLGLAILVAIVGAFGRIIMNDSHIF